MIYPPDGINFDFHKDKILWMLNNNPQCQWNDFLGDPFNIPRASLSKYINRLINEESIVKMPVKGKRFNQYKITPKGQLAYLEMLEYADTVDEIEAWKERLAKLRKENHPPGTLYKDPDQDLAYLRKLAHWLAAENMDDPLLNLETLEQLSTIK